MLRGHHSRVFAHARLTDRPAVDLAAWQIARRRAASHFHVGWCASAQSQRDFTAYAPNVIEVPFRATPPQRVLLLID